MAAVLGLSAAAALPPFSVLPLLVPRFTGLVWLIDGSRSTRSAFAAGWWFGLGHFVLGLYWIGEAFLVDPAKFGWMNPFAVLGLSGSLALFPALAASAAYLSVCSGVGRVLILAAAWTGAEWLRGTILTGFPWDLIGYVWTVSGAMLQLTAITGIYGLSLMTVAGAAMPAVLAGTRRRRREWLAVTAAAAMLAAIWVAGSVRIEIAQTDDVAGVWLRLVQPGIPQTDKESADKQAEDFERLLGLSAVPAKRPVTVIIWPETAVSFVLDIDSAVRERIAPVVPPGGLVVTGAPRSAQEPDGSCRFWNSVFAINAAAAVVASYDKFHLVPFGEYMPLRKCLPLNAIAAGPIDYSAGPGPQTIDLPGLPPVSPLVCYEAIFPGEVVSPANRPAWLLNVTNDAWFGDSAGPYQHFAIARTRAVKEGLPLVRAANTGISGVIDPYGRIVARLGLGQTGTLDAPLPKALGELTPYARFGDWTVLAMLLAAVGLGLAVNER
jgi:apolipoprotein N-acyltransferase